MYCTALFQFIIYCLVDLSKLKTFITEICVKKIIVSMITIYIFDVQQQQCSFIKKQMFHFSQLAVHLFK